MNNKDQEILTAIVMFRKGSSSEFTSEASIFNDAPMLVPTCTPKPWPVLHAPVGARDVSMMTFRAWII
jgi:hypothetical protein